MKKAQATVRGADVKDPELLISNQYLSCDG